MKRYLVTGGCGFIGSHLVDALLARGDAVRVLDDLSTGSLSNHSDAAELVKGDILDAGLVRDCLADVDGCFHLAAIAAVQNSEQTSPRAHQVNLVGSITVFDAVGQRMSAINEVPIVYASSAAVYGDAEETPTSERAKTNPISAYGSDKSAAEQHARDAWQRSNIASTGLRMFNVYGPRQDPSSPYSGVISIFLDKLLGEAPAEIFSDGEQVRDFVYVGDAVAHLLAAMDAPPAGCEIFNVCSGRGTTINRLYEMLQELTGTDLPASYQPARSIDIRTSVGDPSAAAQHLSILANTDLREGLGRTLQHHLASDSRAAKTIAAVSD